MTYLNNKNVGTGKVKVTMNKDSYAEGEKTIEFTIKESEPTKTVKKSNTLTVNGSTKTVKFNTVKKKNVIVTAITVKKNKGAVSYKKSSGNGKIVVISKTGKITVKKGIKKVTYKIKVKVTAKGDKNYKSGSKTVLITIKVK